MDKNRIKSFAVWARKAMIGAVGDRAFKVGIEENKIHEIERLQGGFKVIGREEIFNIAPSHRDKLVELVNEKGYEQVIEEVSYTWFNRFMGLRYMEVNDYLPTGVRILSSEEEGKKEPDVLSKLNDIADDLNLDMNYVYELHDKNTEQAREELYKYILVRQYNELGNIIPQMFEKIQDYTELLLPDNLLQEGSVIRKMVEDIEEDDWKEEVEIIGWMYQYYISEKKDEVFAALKKNVKITKENIPAATQLFTPKWIVKYMVENSLGRLWLEGHPNEELQKEWKYYLEEAEQEPDVEEELKKIREEHSKLTPEDIKVLDPCMGSGHILVYAFDVLYEIYKSAGYSEREIPRLILQNNLYGLDIDDRAAQLASFALIMKARQYNRRLFRETEREELDLNLCSIQESNGISDEAIEYFTNGNEQLKNDIEYLVNNFKDAKEYGSILEVKKINFELVNKRLIEIEGDETLLFGDFRKIIIDKLPSIIKQSIVMSREFNVCVTNPPYMGNKGINIKLKKYIETFYNEVRNDLFSVYIERNIKYCKENGKLGFMTPFVWLFLSTYEQVRDLVTTCNSITTLIHLEYSSFEDATVPLCTFTLEKSNLKKNGMYIRLTDFIGGMKIQEDKYLEAVNTKNSKYKYTSNSKEFSLIPSKPIAYWLTKSAISHFEMDRVLKEVFSPKAGLSTGDNERFLRQWWEVAIADIYFDGKERSDFITKAFEYKWFPMTKGGNYRKWYGNNEFILNFKNDGAELKHWLVNNPNDPTTKSYSRYIRNYDLYLQKGISFNDISSGSPSFRLQTEGFIPNARGPYIYADSYQLLGLLNSKVTKYFLGVLAPTLTFNVGDVARIPYVESRDMEVGNSVKDLVNSSKKDWDSFECSWDFKNHPLVSLKGIKVNHKLSEVYKVLSINLEENFDMQKNNEEKINEYFINLYELQDVLTSALEDKDITIRKADRERDIKSFISYAVGCIFGRYSIDAEGLIYAGGEFSDKWQFESDNTLVRDIQKDEDGNVISDTWVESRFAPDLDNIIPITEDEYFEDDIVARFIDFVKIVYGDEYLEENLDFIADSIGKKSTETSRQAIIRYFIKDFYKDHLKVYQKRPIYWMFDSGKNDGFKALVYMHRYDESTVAKLRTDYLHSLQRKYEAEIVRQQQLSESNALSAREKTAAKKKIDRINKQLEEIKLYDQVVAHVANERISIDLDDGVKHNYDLFQGVIVPTDSGKEVKMDLLAKI